MRSLTISMLAAWLAASFFPAVCAGQSEQSLPRFGVGVKGSTLGVGVEVGTAVASHSNVRVGFNNFTYSKNFDNDGIDYGGKLQLRSFQVLFDQYLVGGFHVSPGALIYNGNRGTATVSVPGGRSFNLGDADFYSDPANPVTGTGTLELGKAAPMLLLGFGNLLPRSGRHFAFNFEFGAVFQGSPKTTLNLAGSTCAPYGGVCQSIAANPDVQSHIRSEQDKLNHDLEPFKYYPVISIGLGYSF